METVRHIAYVNSRLSYSKTGNGQKVLLLFHGFGQDRSAFHKWVDALKESHTLYTFDLFFHGASHWSSRRAVEKTDWKEIMLLFLKQEDIKEFGVVGFSLGGKFAMITAEGFPSLVNELTLLAPDGIKTSFWYSLATYSIAVRALFKSMILHPNRLYHLTKLLRRLKIVDQGLLRFAEAQMDTEEKRRRVYFTWVYFRHLKPDLTLLPSLLNDYTIPCRLLIGKYDKVIQADNMKAFVGEIEKIRFEVIEAGHNDLIAKSITHLFK
ncbi:MAG: alpha/beta hydrolase [Cyclobacteriaceae bacterium]|nr:alpha/beta hydrolase [Cyclobacteriaceae bacterium]